MAATYTAVPSSEDSAESGSQESFEQKVTKVTARTVSYDQRDPAPASPWFLASLAIAIFCIILNLFVPVRMSILYRPNIYIGLDKLNSTMIQLSLPPKLTVFPHIFSPVSSEEPNRVFRTDGNARITFEGLVSPGEPHVIINKHVSMIAQHRVQDYGLQRCAIASTIPNPALLPAQNRTLTLSPFDFEIEIWLLNAEALLDVRKLSWNTRPSRKSKIGTVVVRRDAEMFSPEFSCGAPGSVRTYELACKKDDSLCDLAFIQMQPETKPRMAFTIEQRP
jgi:hypothetical protein